MTDSTHSFYRLRALLALAAALSAGPSQAKEWGAFDFSLNGFGTFGVVHSDYDKADFVTANYFHPKGAGFSHSWDAAQDTNLGIQLTATFAQRLTALLQVVCEQRYDNTFRPELEWANLKYELTPEWSIGVGRVVLPTFLTSETQKVGYVNPWVRTPAEVLVQLPTTNSDGADVSYQVHIGDVSNRVQITYGGHKEPLLGGYTYSDHDLKSVADIVEYGFATVHLSYVNMHYSYDLSAVGHPPEYRFSGVELGVAYDPGDWYVTGELFNTHDELGGHTQAWYLGGGYRVGKVTAYTAWSQIEQTSVGTSGISPFLNQRSPMAGIRWDFRKNLDAKLQFEQKKIGSLVLPTSFVNVQPGARQADSARVLSITLDFVW